PSPLFLIDPSPPATHPLSLHDALPISLDAVARQHQRRGRQAPHQFDPDAQAAGRTEQPGRLVVVASDPGDGERVAGEAGEPGITDRKSTRLNSSHVKISYAVFCLKKKT